MARSVASTVENSFVKGLVTEATGLQAPEDSLVEMDNCVVDRLGAIERRLGIDLEINYDTVVVDKTASAIVEYQWKNVIGDGSKSFLVVQIGATLYFYNISDGVQSVSLGLESGTIDLTTHQRSGTPDIRLAECQFAGGLSRLFVTHPSCDNVYIVYDDDTDTFTSQSYTLYIRDFEGVEDHWAVDYRPTGTLDDEHKYNLYNQGWDDTKITAFETAASAYPSNADVWWWFKDTDDVYNPGTTLDNVARGNTPAAKGHYILPVYNQDRSAASGIAGLPGTSSASSTSTIAFFAGRVFHAGIASSGFNSKLYFSQIIQKNDQIGKCYQANDPTAEILFAPGADDGGVLTIPEAGTIYHMEPVGNSLFIFAYHGIWQLTGSTGLGFTAIDYVLAKMPDGVRTTSASSFVTVNGLPMWWNPDGIFAIVPSQSGGFKVQSATWSTIQSFYDDIPNVSKTTARGCYNPVDRVVSWVYSSVAPSTQEDRYTFDSILNLNTESGAFYPWSLSTGVSVHGILAVDSQGATTEETVIIDEDGDDVVDDDGDTLVSYALSNLSYGPRTKLLVSFENAGTQLTFAELNDFTYTDWSSLPAARSDFESYFITAYRLHSNASKKFQPNYVLFYHEGHGSLHFQGIWDYALTGNTGRYTQRQLLQFDDFDYSVKAKKLKMRGQGRTLQYRGQSISQQPFRCIGWAVWETADTLP